MQTSAPSWGILVHTHELHLQVPHISYNEGYILHCLDNQHNVLIAMATEEEYLRVHEEVTNSLKAAIALLHQMRHLMTFKNKWVM